MNELILFSIKPRGSKSLKTAKNNGNEKTYNKNYGK